LLLRPSQRPSVATACPGNSLMAMQTDSESGEQGWRRRMQKKYGIDSARG